MSAILGIVLGFLQPILSDVLKAIVVDVLFAPTKHTAVEAKSDENPTSFVFARPL